MEGEKGVRASVFQWENGGGTRENVEKTDATKSPVTMDIHEVSPYHPCTGTPYGAQPGGLPSLLVYMQKRVCGVSCVSLSYRRSGLCVIPPGGPRRDS
jgi:hypothetical protein